MPVWNDTTELALTGGDHNPAANDVRPQGPPSAGGGHSASPGPGGFGARVRDEIPHAFGLILLLLIVAVASVPLVPGIVRRIPGWHGGMLLRLVAVFSLSFLPAWLFVRFICVRAGSLWVEYVLNLHRLGIDEPQHLPEPPDSIYHDRWATARRQSEHPSPRPGEEDAASIYVQKFEAYYGRGTATAAGHRGRIKIETFFPVLLCTAVFAVGWVTVLVQWNNWNAGHVGMEEVLAFAFMGAYVFSLQMLVRRYFQADLRASAYLSVVVRVFTALIVAAVVYRGGVADLLRPGSWTDAQHVAIAFGIGFLPIAGLQALHKLFCAGLRQVTHLPALTSDYPLGDLDGLNIWYEARLLEEGIEDLQNLATANLVEVMLHTRVPVGRLVDWVDQAHLYLHLERPKRDRRGTWERDGDRGVFRRLGIRTATDLEEAMLGPRAARSAEGSRPAPDDELAKAIAAVRREGDVSIATTVLRTLAREPNMRHVRRWRENWATRQPCRPVDKGINGSAHRAREAGKNGSTP